MSPSWSLLFKNNTDSAGNSYGCHENYLVTRDVSFQRLGESLIPFFVTRQIFTGAGKVLQTTRGFHYCLSQRAQGGRCATGGPHPGLSGRRRRRCLRAFLAAVGVVRLIMTSPSSRRRSGDDEVVPHNGQR
jgi:hypothetical protein